MITADTGTPSPANSWIQLEDLEEIERLERAHATPPSSPTPSRITNSSAFSSTTEEDRVSVVSEPIRDNLADSRIDNARCRSKSLGECCSHHRGVTVDHLDVRARVQISRELCISLERLLRVDEELLRSSALVPVDESKDVDNSANGVRRPRRRNIEHQNNLNRRKRKIATKYSPVVRKKSSHCLNVNSKAPSNEANSMLLRIQPPTLEHPNSCSMGVTSIGRLPHDDTYEVIGADPSNSNSNIYTIPACNTNSLKDGGRRRGGRLTDSLVDDKTSSSLNIYSPSPTPDYDKCEEFKKRLSVVLSAIYAVFLVVAAMVIYMADVLYDYPDVVELFNISVTSVGLLWLVFIHYDIRRHANWRRKRERPVDRINGSNPGNANTNGRDFDVEAKESNIRPRCENHYFFQTGRHSGSFYLKIGAAAFCCGHLIHEGLLLSRPITYLTMEDKRDCFKITTLTLDIVHPVLSFYQLFFIFKYSHVVINRFREAARFALMHIIATNLCFWIHTIFRETVESMQHKMDTNLTVKFPLFISLVNKSRQNRECMSPHMSFSNFTQVASPYLYPFTIEYSLLLVGVWYIIWHNIGKVKRYPDSEETRRDSSSVKSDDNYTSNLVIHVDCHSANRGLFAGLLVFLVTVVSVIIFFVSVMHTEYVATGVLINNVSDLVLVALMTVSTLVAYKQICKLDINPHAVTFLDDTLLFVALPCFFLYGIFNVIAGFAAKNWFSIASGVMSAVQVSLQTPFIMDGLRRCSNSQVLRYQKPGRELITFLVVCNLAMWVLETFEIKSTEAHWDKVRVYGTFMWTCMSHVTLPLTLFYRFHSSVCLVDIWKSAYEVGEA